MAPDGQFFAPQATTEDNARSALIAISPHLVATLPPQKITLAELHLFLQQTRLNAPGKVAGILDGTFATRLKDLTDEELKAWLEKKRITLESAYAFDVKFNQVGEKIAVAIDIIDEKIDAINAEIKVETKRADADSGENDRSAKMAKRSENRIEALRDQKGKLENINKNLTEKNKARAKAPDIEKLTEVEKAVDNIKDTVQSMPSPHTVAPHFPYGVSDDETDDDKPGANV